MKSYYYGEPSGLLLRSLAAFKRKSRVVGVAIGVVFVAPIVVALILSWAFVKLGEFGHFIARDLIGFDSREYW